MCRTEVRNKSQFDKEAWLRDLLRGESRLDVCEDKDERPSDNVNSMQESDNPQDKCKRNLIWENFHIEENEMLNQDETIKEEEIKKPTSLERVNVSG